MTSGLAVRLRRLAVVVLALACLSPAAVSWPDLPSVPALLGLVPEPLPAPAPTPATVFEAAEGAAPSPAFAASQRPDAGAGTARGVRRPPPTPPPPDRTSAGARTGSSLPVLPPDEIPRGRYHRVEPGETIASIAAAYGLSSKWAVYDANPIIVDPGAPPAGTWLYIPHPSMSPQPRPRPGQPGYSDTPSATVIVDGVWLELAQCESSGDWGIDTGNSYYGGLQFTLSSWKAVGGAGYPHQAHPMEQIARADYLQRIQGWQAWPMCAGKLGLISKAEADEIVRKARARQRGEAPAGSAEASSHDAATERATD